MFALLKPLFPLPFSLEEDPDSFYPALCFLKGHLRKVARGVGWALGNWRGNKDTEATLESCISAVPKMEGGLWLVDPHGEILSHRLSLSCPFQAMTVYKRNSKGSDFWGGKLKFGKSAMAEWLPWNSFLMNSRRRCLWEKMWPLADSSSCLRHVWFLAFHFACGSLYDYTPAVAIQVT